LADIGIFAYLCTLELEILIYHKINEANKKTDHKMLDQSLGDTVEDIASAIPLLMSL